MKSKLVYVCMLISGVQDTYCGLEHNSIQAANKCKARTKGDIYKPVQRLKGFYERRFFFGGNEYQYNDKITHRRTSDEV